MTFKFYKLIIDDLEKCEAEKIMQFLKDACDEDELEFQISDCMSIEEVNLIEPEIKNNDEGL